MSHDPILAEAVSRLAIAKAEVLRLEAFIDVYHELGGKPAQPPPRTTNVMRAKSVSTATTGALADSAAAAAAYIKSVGRPVPTRDLIGVLEGQGISVGGKDEIATLSARLSRSPLLVNIRGVGWQLADAGEERAVGDLLHSIPTAPGSTLNSADEDGREVGHEKIDLSQF